MTFGLTTLATMLLSSLLGLAALAWLPSPDESREVAVWRALPPSDPEVQVPPYRAADFCADWTGQPTAKVDCRTGFVMGTLAPADHPGAAQAWARAHEAARARLQEASRLSQLLQQQLTAPPNPALSQVVFHLKARTDRWQERWSRLGRPGDPQIGQAAYTELFLLLLDLHGQTYDAVGDRFKFINWHLARALDRPSALRARGQALEWHLRWAPWAMVGASALLLIVGWAGWRWRGWLLMAGLSTIACAGLLVVADASVRFGQGSAVFAFNPLGNQMVRQSGILLAVTALVLLIVVAAPLLRPVLRLCSLRAGWLMMGLLLAMLAGYGLLGPAGGSELLKVGMALTAGLITALHGRSVHLAGELAPGAMQPGYLLRQLFNRAPSHALSDPLALIARKLGPPILQMAGFTTLSLALAALVFNDLGASLVTACIAVSALYFVFGARITLAVTAAMVGAALLASQTTKVQARLALMVDPLSASISDFARLVAFEQATPNFVAGFGKIAWCNGVGSCIPLQSLSDYMPVVLSGALGRYGTVIYFLGFVITLIALAAWLIRRSLTQGDLEARTLTLIAFYLLLGTLVQTLVTFLGNWRVIPLTGLGTPLVSIGFSSFLAPALALALIVALPRIEKPTGRA